MASQDRTAPAALAAPDGAVADLLANPAGYSFFQALRLLRLSMTDAQALREAVRVRPALSLAFPETDLAAVDIEDGHYRIEANFFGLYGVTSPLPTFYTEDLIEEARQGGTASRDFLDIFHAVLYPLLFAAWEKYRLWLAVAEHRDEHRLDQLRALVGALGADTEAPFDPVALLPYAGNLSQMPRSALGLQGLLRGLLEGAEVDVQPCVVATVEIPAEARACLGEGACTLGEDALLGQRMRDRAGNMRIVVGPLPARRFHALLPGRPLHAALAHTVERTLHTPLRCELGLRLDRREGRGASLGEGWTQLGYDTWLGAPRPDAAADAEVRFPLAIGALRSRAAPSPFRSPVP